MKRSRIIILFLIIIGTFIIREQIIINSINSSTTKKFMQIVSNVQEKYPDIKETEIVSTLIRDSEEADLTVYGIKNYSKEFITSGMNTKRVLSLIIIFLILILIFFLYEIYRQKIIKLKLRKLSNDLKRVSEGIYSIKLINEEDEFSKLQNQIYKMMLKLKEESVAVAAHRNTLQKSMEDISHQIKTPITAINLILDLLNDESLDESAKRGLITDLQKETDAITNLVYMLLNVSLIESNAKEFERDKIEVRRLLDNCTNLLSPMIQDKNIKIENSGDLDSAFIGDFKWEKEVFINLIKNAIEHSNDGNIIINVKDTTAYTEIMVQNKGKTIPEEYHSKIFERFFRLNKEDGNFGIGLNLCKMIVERDGGKIYLDSKNGITKFFVRYFKMNTI